MKYNSLGQSLSKKGNIAEKRSVTRVVALLLVLALSLELPCGIKSFAGTSTNGVYSAQVYYGIYKEIRFDSDSRLTNAAGGGITLVTNGTKAYGSAELYTNISGTYYFVPDDKGKVKSTQSKVVCVITESKDKPSIEGKGNSSKGATASASIRNGVITVKAGKNPKTVYLHIIDTGSGVEENGREGAYACCEIKVLAAPSKIIAKQDGEVTNTVVIENGKNAEFYVNPYYVTEAGEEIIVPEESINEPGAEGAGTIKTNKVEAGLDPKSAPYFDITGPDASGKYTVTLKALNNGKKTKGKITFKSPITDAKLVVSIEATNPIKTVTGFSTESAKMQISGDKITYEIPNNKTSVGAKISPTVKITAQNQNNSLECSDTVKIYALAAQGAFTTDEKKGTIKVTAKPNKEQSRIKVKMNKDKKSFTINIPKGTKATTAYFVISYSSGYSKEFSVEIKSNASSPTPAP